MTALTETRHRQARKGPMDMNRDRFELDLTLEEVIADLNYGAGTDAETDRLVPASRREARGLHLVHEDRQVINVSGVSVDPTAVEEVLNRHPKVAKAAAIGVPDAGTGEAVKAFIVLSEGGSAEQILGWMRDPSTGIATYLVPKHIEFRRSLPPTMDGEPETAAVLRQAYVQTEKEDR